MSDRYTQRRRENGWAGAHAAHTHTRAARDLAGSSRRGYPHPTRWSRLLGYVLVMGALLALMGLAGWVEGGFR